MIKVAIAGANSGLALEIIDKLVEDQTHEVVALCRRDPADYPKQPNVKWVQTDFQSKAELIGLFEGVEVVLSFIVVHKDPGIAISKRLVDAAIEAGVKRFAPSEWAMSQKLHDIISGAPWYQGKIDMQAYLRELNKDNKVIEYCFFQPGMFMDYAFFPHQIAKHVPALPTTWQLDDQRIVAVKGHEDDPVTMTTASDIAAIVRLAIEFQGPWPEVGGIAGEQISPRAMQKLAERIRGMPVQLDLAQESDVENGVLIVDMPELQHPSIPEDQRQAFHVPIWAGTLNAVAKGAWTVTDEWNKLLPNYKFTTLEELMEKAWGRK